MYQPYWREAFGGYTRTKHILFKLGETGEKIISSKMTDKARVLHQVPNKMIIRKVGSKDFVSGLHEFLLTHLLTYRKVNMFSQRCLKQREEKCDFFWSSVAKGDEYPMHNGDTGSIQRC